MVEFSQIPEVSGIKAIDRLRFYQHAIRKWRPYLSYSEQAFFLYLADQMVGFGRNYVCGTVERFASGAKADGSPSKIAPSHMPVRTMYAALRSLRQKGLIAVEHRYSNRKTKGKESLGPGRPTGMTYSVFKANLDWTPENYAVLPIPKKKREKTERPKSTFLLRIEEQASDFIEETVEPSLDNVTDNLAVKPPQKPGNFTAKFSCLKREEERVLKTEATARDRAAGEGEDNKEVSSPVETVSPPTPVILRDRKVADVITDLYTRRTALRRSRPKTTRGVWQEAWETTFVGVPCAPFTPRDIAMLKREEKRLVSAGVDWHGYLAFCVQQWPGIMRQKFRKMDSHPAFPHVGFLVRLSGTFLDCYQQDQSMSQRAPVRHLTEAGKSVMQEVVNRLRGGEDLVEVIASVTMRSTDDALTKQIQERLDIVRERERLADIRERAIIAPPNTGRHTAPVDVKLSVSTHSGAANFENPELDETMNEDFGEWKDD